MENGHEKRGAGEGIGFLIDLNTLLDLDDKKLGEIWNSNTSIVNKGGIMRLPWA